MDKKSPKKTALKNLKTSLNKTKTQTKFLKTSFKTIYKNKKRKKKQTQAIQGTQYDWPKEPKKSIYFTKIHKIRNT